MGFKPIATSRSATGIPTGRLAVWWVLCSEIVIFGGVLASYIMHRIGHPEWAYQAAWTNTAAGATNTFVLLTSSLFVVLAHNAAERRQAAKAVQWLLAAVAGGGVFLVIKGFEWSTEISHGFTPDSSPFWAFYFTAGGIHGLHVIAGMILMLWVANNVRKEDDWHHVENVGLYWHFVDIVWIFLFPLLYIAK